MSDPSWPDPPTAGRMVRLPLPLPPMLLDAAGYTGGARYVALFWMPYGDELMLADGQITATGWWPAFTTLAHHPLGQIILGPFELGSSDSEAAHWLLADRLAGTLDVGLELDVRQLLATQPSELAAAAHELGADRVRRLLIDQFKTPRALSPTEVHAQLERSRRLLDELRDWLDAVAHRSLQDT